jgi:MoaA/NifB/PqqE/SkfB family radical SAM enzyme
MSSIEKRNITGLFFKQRNMFIDWQLSNICNYSCTYCNFRSNGGNFGWPTLEQSTKLVDKILEKSDHTYRTYNLLGGEPVLWREFGELTRYIKENDSNSVIQILTNAGRTLRWWKQYAETFDKVVITHHAHAASAEHIADVVEAIYPYCTVSVQVLVDVNNFHKVVSDFDYLIDRLNGIHVSPKKAETHLGSGIWMDYSPEQLKWIDDAYEQTIINNRIPTSIEELRDKNKFYREMYATDGNHTWVSSNKELIITDKNHFNGWKCNIGTDMVCINSNGDITPASSCFQTEILGNYKTGGDIKWPSASYTCIYDGCFCGADIEIEKWKK